MLTAFRVNELAEEDYKALEDALNDKKSSRAKGKAIPEGDPKELLHKWDCDCGKKDCSECGTGWSKVPVVKPVGDIRGVYRDNDDNWIVPF